jgi:hypothetical protein
MNAHTEPGPGETRDEESFPWLDDLQERGIWMTDDQLAPPRRARFAEVSRPTLRRVVIERVVPSSIA